MHEHVNSVAVALSYILTGRHALCLRVQSREARSIDAEGRDCSGDAGSSNRFGKKVRDVFVAGNEGDSDRFAQDEVSHKMEPKVHMFGAKTILADLT
jgi:hypothetical protein